jgi:FkbM family methyltransferase
MPRRNILTVRLGTDYGGRVIPSGFLNSESICYCVGAGEDISFDLALVQQFGARAWILDPTPRAIEHYRDLQRRTLAGQKQSINREPEVVYDLVPEDLLRLQYLPFGLWSKDDVLKFYAPANTEHVSHSLVNLQRTTSHIEVPVRRLKNVMDELGHQRIDLLKLDIEGAEYAVLDSVLEDDLDVSVICSEYDEWHHPLDDGALSRINGSIARMKRGGYVLADIDNDCNVMYIRKELFKRVASRRLR